MITLTFGIIQFAAIGGILLYEFCGKSSSVFLWATLMIMFGMPHLLSCFTGDLQYSNDTLSMASLFVIMFCLVYFVVRVSMGTKYRWANRQRFQYEALRESVLSENESHKILFLILIADIVFKLYPFIRSSGGLLATSWGSARAYSSDLSYVNSGQVTSIIYYSLSGIVLYYQLEGKKRLFILSALLYLITVIITRNRMEVLPFLCAIISIIIYKNKRISPKIVILGIVGAFLVIYFIYGLWVFRHYGSISNFISSFNFSDFINRINDHLRNDTDNGELNYRKWFYFFIQKNNDFPNFNRGHSYVRMLLVYLPTQFTFGIKPPDFAQSMGSAIGMVQGGSMHPTLFGDCFANFNYFGILAGAIWAAYVSFMDRITIRKDTFNSVLIYTLNAVAYVIIGRGSVYNGFVPVAYGVLLISIIAYARKHVRFKIISKKDKAKYNLE